MDSSEVHDLIDRLAAVEACAGDRHRLNQVLAAGRRVRAWCEAGETRAAGLLAQILSCPEKDVAEASGTTVRQASKVTRRADTVALLPAVGAVFARGDIGAAHIDVVAGARAGLAAHLRPLLDAQVDAQAARAAGMAVDDFARVVRGIVKQIETDDGIDRLQRQRRAARLRGWVDRETGMYHLAGQFDPVTGIAIDDALHAMVNRMFAEQTPDTCPDDPHAKTEHLRALAAAALLTGTATAATVRPQAIVVIDATTTDVDGGPIVEWTLPVEIPRRVLNEFLTDADTHVDVVVVRNGIVLYAPGQLNLGRTTRLASPAQRKALRALYPTCPVDGCTVHFRDCHIHHIHWWEHLGPTDLDNLIPLCNHHHHRIHNDSWHLHLAPDRTLTITLPDGTTLTTPPPRTKPKAAA